MHQIISIAVFVGVMALIISEKIHRAVAALAGAVILFFVGILSFEQGMEAVDFNTLGVLCGMMMFVAVVKCSGLFEFTAIYSAKLAKGKPWPIMVAFVLITAVLSALLDNVTTVLLVGPMTYTVCKHLKLNPVPFFMTEILASNIGGTATLIGDPPNIMIGSQAGYTFADFVMVDTPAVIVILALSLVVFYFLYGRKLTVTPEDAQYICDLDPMEQIKDMGLFRKSIVMIVVVAFGFMMHGALDVESSVIALAAATIMFFISGANLEEMLHDVEWATIGFFAGLFIVVGGMEETGVITMLANAIVNATAGQAFVMMIVILWASAIISSILDNIPFVATMAPVILTIATTGVDVTPLWWALSLGACLGGNGTLIGASANVVLTSISARDGYPISFIDFLKVGFPMMIFTTAIATVYMILRFGLAML